MSCSNDGFILCTNQMANDMTIKNFLEEKVLSALTNIVVYSSCLPFQVSKTPLLKCNYNTSGWPFVTVHSFYALGKILNVGH